MTLRINNNTAALNTHRMLLGNDAALSKSLERLSSGMRINKAADDAAGLVISEQMRAQITGLNQAIDNAETGISMVQSTEGALDEINNLLNKARELTLHAANTGANDDNQLRADQAELDNVIQSITRISEFTQFGTKKLIDGSMSGVSDLGTGLNRVRPGNLSNNPAISVGTVNAVVVAGTSEANLLLGGDAQDGYLFTYTGGSLTGINLGTGVVNSGVTVSLTIDGNTLAYVSTVAQTSTQVASSLNALTSGFTVSVGSGGGFKVTRDQVGAEDFTTSISFSRGARPQINGTPESVTASVTLTAGNNANAANVIFSGLGALSGVNETTAVASGTVFTVTLATTTGGAFSTSYTASGTDTLYSVLTQLQTSVQGGGLANFSGSTVTFVGGTTSGFQVNLARGSAEDAVETDFNFTLEVDFPNAVSTLSEVHFASVNTISGLTQSGVAGAPANTSTLVDGAGAGLASGTAFSGATTSLASGAAISMTLNGITHVITGGAGTTLDALASQFSALFSADGFSVVFLSGSEAGAGVFAGLTPATGGFLAGRSDGADFSFSISFDQLHGADADFDGFELQDGALQQATLNLDTTEQDRTDNIASSTFHASAVVTNDPDDTVNTAGTDITATLTSANGVSLGMSQRMITSSGSASLELDAATIALGYENVLVELTTGMSIAGGATTFVLDNGAEFQVGPNANQKVGVTVLSVAATELGRNVSSAGPITSLDDLVSTNRGALVNGYTTQALRVIDAAIDEVTNVRGRLGAVQANTLETGLRGLRAAQENLSSAESTIRDTDFAAESARFTRNNILVQASTAMLAQANQLPQSVLQLLQ